MSRKFLLLSLIVGICSGLSHAKTTAKPVVPDILDAAALKDGSDGKSPVDPCQDFYQFACGQWIEKTIIPADKDRVMHQSTALIDRMDENLNQLILKLKSNDSQLQTKASKQIVDYYDSCM